jgi:hypothetical protein
MAKTSRSDGVRLAALEKDVQEIKELLLSGARIKSRYGRIDIDSPICVNRDFPDKRRGKTDAGRFVLHSLPVHSHAAYRGKRLTNGLFYVGPKKDWSKDIAEAMVFKFQSKGMKTCRGLAAPGPVVANNSKRPIKFHRPCLYALLEDSNG